MVKDPSERRGNALRDRGNADQLGTRQADRPGAAAAAAAVKSLRSSAGVSSKEHERDRAAGDRRLQPLPPPKQRTLPPHRRPQSPSRTLPSPGRRPVDPSSRRPLSPGRHPDPRRPPSPNRRPPSPGMRPLSPGRRPPSPGRRPPSPGRRPPSPGRRPPSPNRRPPSPGRRPPSPGRRPPSPNRRPPSPGRRPPSPPRHHRRPPSPAHRGRPGSPPLQRRPDRDPNPRDRDHVTAAGIHRRELPPHEQQRRHPAAAAAARGDDRSYRDRDRRHSQGPVQRRDDVADRHGHARKRGSSREPGSSSREQQQHAAPGQLPVVAPDMCNAFGILEKFLDKHSQLKEVVSPNNQNVIIVHVRSSDFVTFAGVQKWLATRMGLHLQLLAGTFVLCPAEDIPLPGDAADAERAAVPLRFRQVAAVQTQDEAVPHDAADTVVLLEGGGEVRAGRLSDLPMEELPDNEELCCELSSLQLEELMPLLRLYGLAHTIWRLKLCNDLEGIIQDFEKEQADLRAKGMDAEVLDMAASAAYNAIRTRMTQLPKANFVDEVLQYITLIPGGPTLLQQQLRTEAARWRDYLQLTLSLPPEQRQQQQQHVSPDDAPLAAGSDAGFHSGLSPLDDHNMQQQTYAQQPQQQQAYGDHQQQQELLPYEHQEFGLGADFEEAAMFDDPTGLDGLVTLEPQHLHGTAFGAPLQSQGSLGFGMGSNPAATSSGMRLALSAAASRAGGLQQQQQPAGLGTVRSFGSGMPAGAGLQQNSDVQAFMSKYDSVGMQRQGSVGNANTAAAAAASGAGLDYNYWVVQGDITAAELNPALRKAPAHFQTTTTSRVLPGQGFSGLPPGLGPPNPPGLAPQQQQQHSDSSRDRQDRKEDRDRQDPRDRRDERVSVLDRLGQNLSERPQQRDPGHHGGSSSSRHRASTPDGRSSSRGKTVRLSPEAPGRPPRDREKEKRSRTEDSKAAARDRSRSRDRDEAKEKHREADNSIGRSQEPDKSASTGRERGSRDGKGSRQPERGRSPSSRGRDAERSTARGQEHSREGRDSRQQQQQQPPERGRSPVPGGSSSRRASSQEPLRVSRRQLLDASPDPLPGAQKRTNRDRQAADAARSSKHASKEELGRQDSKPGQPDSRKDKSTAQDGREPSPGLAEVLKRLLPPAAPAQPPAAAAARVHHRSSRSRSRSLSRGRGRPRSRSPSGASRPSKQARLSLHDRSGAAAAPAAGGFSPVPLDSARRRFEGRLEGADRLFGELSAEAATRQWLHRMSDLIAAGEARHEEGRCFRLKFLQENLPIPDEAIKAWGSVYQFLSRHPALIWKPTLKLVGLKEGIDIDALEMLPEKLPLSAEQRTGERWTGSTALNPVLRGAGRPGLGGPACNGPGFGDRKAAGPGGPVYRDRQAAGSGFREPGGPGLRDAAGQGFRPRDGDRGPGWHPGARPSSRSEEQPPPPAPLTPEDRAAVEFQNTLSSYACMLRQSLAEAPNHGMDLDEAYGLLPPQLREKIQPGGSVDLPKVLVDHIGGVDVMRSQGRTTVQAIPPGATEPWAPRPCMYWDVNAWGGCRKGAKCDFRHDLLAKGFRNISPAGWL